MLSLLIDTDVFRYSYTQLIHMYKQLYATKNINHAGGGYTIMFYAIEFHMFICVLLIIDFSYEYMNTHSYVIYMNVCTYVHMRYITLVVYNRITYVYIEFC